MAKKRYVIIGSSAAGIRAAEAIRRLHPHEPIIMISDEKTPLYSRCLLPGFLAGEKNEKELMFRPENFFQDLSIEPYLGEKVTSIDTARHKLRTKAGKMINYDKLLIATGSSSFIPPVPGLNGPGVVGLRTIQDARQIADWTRGARRALIVGAGFVGLEAAYALYRRGLEVTVIEKFPRVLPQQLDETAAEIIRRDLQSEGVRLLLGTGIKEIRNKGFLQRLLSKNYGKEVLLENGDPLKTDFIIVAAGTRPNTQLLENSGIEINRGIPVNEFMETNVENIYAAGDVAETYDAVTGTKGLTPIWPNAVVQGRVAGCNMAGCRQKYGAQIAMQNAVEFREVPAIALGLVNPQEEKEYEILLYHQPERNIYKKLVLKDNIPVGVILVGNIHQAGIIAGLIRNKKQMNEKIKETFLYGNLHYGYFLPPAKGILPIARAAR